jgi:hypothetical protein
VGAGQRLEGPLPLSGPHPRRDPAGIWAPASRSALVQGNAASVPLMRCGTPSVIHFGAGAPLR